MKAYFHSPTLNHVEPSIGLVYFLYVFTKLFDAPIKAW